MSEPLLPENSRGAGDLRVTAAPTTDIPPLSANYKLDPEQTAFFKAQTRIDDDDELRNHILAVQERSFKVFPYGCIKLFTFLEHGMAMLPAYNAVMQLGQERPDGILLDVGACFSVDSRKAVADGYPLENIVTTDLHPEFFDLGHDLFRTTPASYPINFVAGDIFDTEVLQIFPPWDRPPSTARPNLSTLASLNPLAGHCAVIYIGNVFHLFSEDNQLHLAKALAGLLSPLPGSTIFGLHGASLQKGLEHIENGGRAFDIFCHTTESWAALWDGEVFPKGKVKVGAALEKVDKGLGAIFWPMRWSVVRLWADGHCLRKYSLNAVLSCE